MVGDGDVVDVQLIFVDEVEEEIEWTVVDVEFDAIFLMLVLFHSHPRLETWGFYETSSSVARSLNQQW